MTGETIMSIAAAMAVADELSPTPARAVAALRTLRAVIERDQPNAALQEADGAQGASELQRAQSNHLGARDPS